MLSSANVGDLLFKYTAVLEASAQNLFSRLALNSRHLAFSTMVLFDLSQTPFSSGVFALVF